MEENFSKYNGDGTILRQAQVRLLDMLVEVDKICRKHNIPYWLNGGNALGAMRHGGFIPWDDDIDIALLRKDYLKLIPILSKELGNRFVLQNRKNEPFFHMTYSRVVDKNSKIKYGGDHMKFRDHMKYQGLFLDIFYIEKGNPMVKKIIDSLYYPSFFHLSPYSKKYKRIIALLSWPIISFLVFLLRKVNFLFSSKLYVFGYGIRFKERFAINEILPSSPICFEKHEVLGPRNMHSYLKRYFGDYMTIPPEHNRRSHCEVIELF